MDLKPSTIAALGGGIAIFISTFLDWIGFSGFGISVGANVFEGARFGFTGILLLLLAAGIIALSAIPAFAPQVNLPDAVLGFSRNQLTLAAGFAAFIYGFSIIFANSSKFGAILCAIGGAAAVAGAILEDREAPAGDPITRTF